MANVKGHDVRETHFTKWAIIDKSNLGLNVTQVSPNFLLFIKISDELSAIHQIWNELSAAAG